MEREKPLIMRRSMAKRKPLNITMKRAPSITMYPPLSFTSFPYHKKGMLSCGLVEGLRSEAL
jgi:hypothetical protein